MELEIIRGDITTLSVDVIVNAANSSLLGGGGVDGAIHAAAGPELLQACKRIRRDEYPQGLPTGKAVITPGFNLPARYVIHTVGPIYDEVDNPSQLLYDAYTSSLGLAEKNGLKTIAFPAISTGVYGYPKEEALEVVKRVMEKYYTNTFLDKVTLCFFSENEKRLAQKRFGIK